MLNAIAMLLEKVLEHAGARKMLDQLDLRVPGVSDIQLDRPVTGLTAIRAFRLARGEVLEAHEFFDADRLDEELLRGCDVLYDPAYLAKRGRKIQSRHLLCSTWVGPSD